jgi:DNA-binding transcriptional LysR family regulator
MANPFPIPLNALRAIEIVARRGALEPAAAELGVTIGAVSQHLRRAEARLGIALFERTPRGLVPTPELVAQMPALRAGFQTLADALGALRRQEDDVLTLTVGSVFASRWLITRLGRFNAAHPDIEFRMVATGKLVDLARSDIDCGIRFGGGQWPETRADLIGGTRAAPFCAPSLRSRLRTPGDFADMPVIRDQASMLSWEKWFATAGFAPPPETSGPVYSDPTLAFDAAVAGQGALMAVDLMAADAVADGRLCRPFDAWLDTGQGYWFVTGANRRVPKKVTLFRDWLTAEVAATARSLA